MWVKLLLYTLFVVIKIVICDETEESEVEDLRVKKDGFLFTMPKTLNNGRNETVCLSLHATKLPAKAIVNLRWKENYFPTLKTLRTEKECFSMHVPRLPINEPKLVGVKVQIQMGGRIYTAHNHDLVLIYPDRTGKTFVETDRAVYKPGDVVKIRILKLNEKLLPDENTISEIKLKNPFDVTVAVWEDVTTDMGLAQISYHLVAESLTGKWKIEANDETITFEVQKYILPKFKVNLYYPKLIYHEKKEVTVRVCAKYSYNKPVNGLGLIKVIDSHSNMQTLYKANRLSQGCANFTLTQKDLNLVDVKQLYTMYDPKIHVHITATVTEDGTDRVQMAMVKSLVAFKPYNVRFVADRVFQPGMIYRGKLQLTNVLVDTRGHMFEICYNIAIKKSWNYLNNEQCSNFTVNKDGMTVNFSIWPLKNNVIHIYLNSRALNHTTVGDSYLVLRQYSSSNNYIYIDDESTDKRKCNRHQDVKVYYTRDKLADNEKINFFYMIRSMQHIQQLNTHEHVVQKQPFLSYHGQKNVIGGKHRFIKYGIQVDHFKLKIHLDNPLITTYQLLVYYVTKTGETIATTKNINLDPCLKHKVHAEWLQTNLYPGSGATMKINTSSDAMCAVTAVDKAVQFMDKLHYFLNERSLVRPFDRENEAAESGRKNCITPSKKTTKVLAYTKPEDLRRKKRHVYPFSEDLDSYDVFQKFGAITISNLRVVTKPCYTGPLITPNGTVQYMILTDYEDENQEKLLPIRSYFPETWLWDLVKVNKNDQLIERPLPHTVTNWVTNVMCVSPTEGVGFSKEMEFSAYQPFFVDVVTPYSLKRDETFYLHINLFNYLNYSFPINIKVEFTDNLELKSNWKNASTVSYCVFKNSTAAHVFNLRTVHTGTANITVTAEVDTHYPRKCGPDSVVNKRDVVIKSVIIEPEGYPMTVTKSAFLCGSSPTDSNNVTWEVKLPNDVVPGTDKAHLTFNGDLLGHTIDNLDHLLTMPTGCGEQIMASMAPNLYAMRYLQATNKLTPTLTQKISRNLKVGYQRILNYAHKDGSFSAFGYYDPSGSMFLTAFVVRTLQEAKQYIYVDQRVIERAVQWIFQHQLENGCFNAMLHVFQDMGGASRENSTASLTAYVLVSLEEAKIEIPQDVKTNAKYCIRGQDIPEQYTLAITCYALFNVRWLSEANRMLNKLISMAHQQQNMMWWSMNDSNVATATDIEITGYILLSLLQQNSTENLAYVHGIVRWLATKQGNHGGFRTTQDTVVALDALTKYATLINKNNLDMKVYIKGTHQHSKITIKNDDKLKSKRIHLREANNKLFIEALGEGCILAQAVFSYYLKHMKKSEVFKLDVDVKSVSNVDPCSVMALHSCISYMGPEVFANMAILEVTLPSGYTVDRASIYKLVDMEAHSKVRRFEEQDDKIILYFTKVDSQQLCITFNIDETSPVESRKASLIKLYDYYKPEYQTVQFYSLNSNCTANRSHLPSINVTSTEKSNRFLNFTNDYIEDVVYKKEEGPVENTLDPLNRNKRHISDVKENKQLNPDFVDMDMDMATPSGMEGNRPVYVKPPKNMIPTLANTNKGGQSRIKRQLVKNKNNDGDDEKLYNLETNFIDVDEEMALPNGVEGNSPVYVKAPKNILYKQRAEKFREQLRIKRQISFKINSSKDYNINTNFVDMDMEMATPSGMEGTNPVYVKPSKELLRNMTRVNN